MVRAKRAQKLVFICGVLAALSGLLRLLTPPERNLWKRAHIVEPAENFTYPTIFGRANPPLRLKSDLPYCWLAPHKLLTLHFGDRSIFSLQPRLVDIDSGRRLSVTRLSRFVSFPLLSISVLRNGATRIQTDFACQASPDGAWILVPGGRAGIHGAIPSVSAAIRTDDGRQAEWTHSRLVLSSVWLRDNRRWVALILEPAGYKISLFDVDRPQTVIDHPFDTPMEDNQGAHADSTLVGTLSDGRVLVVYWSPTVDGKVFTARFLPDLEEENPLKAYITLPSGPNSVLMKPPVLSPAGDRLAWCMLIPRKPPGWPAIRRFWELWKITPKTEVGIWTTRPDGSDAQEIGAYVPKDNGDYPEYLEWTPDGRSLSFRYQGALYETQAR